MPDIKTSGGTDRARNTGGIVFLFVLFSVFLVHLNASFLCASWYALIWGLHTAVLSPKSIICFSTALDTVLSKQYALVQLSVPYYTVDLVQPSILYYNQQYVQYSPRYCTIICSTFSTALHCTLINSRFSTAFDTVLYLCLLYTSPSPRDQA